MKEKAKERETELKLVKEMLAAKERELTEEKSSHGKSSDLERKYQELKDFVLANISSPVPEEGNFVDQLKALVKAQRERSSTPDEAERLFSSTGNLKKGGRRSKQRSIIGQ